jgi:hypothetical protein
MRLIDLDYPRGKHSDIQADPLGWVVILQDEADGHLWFIQLDHEGERRVPDVRIDAAGGAAFPRLYVDAAKQTWLAWRHETLGGMLLNISRGSTTSLGLVHGNCPIAIGAGRVWYQSTGSYALAFRDLANPGLVTQTGSLGLACVDALGMPVLVDDVRLSVPGMVNPQSAGRCTVGEADRPGVGPCNVARLNDGREAEIWPGLISNTPRIATDSAAFAVTTWGGPGVRVAFLTDPPDFREPVPEPPPEDHWAFVPDGTLVTDAFLSMFGDAPRSPDGKRICLHKNVNEQEWREVDAEDGECYHLFDRSRYPGDVGWYLYHDWELPIWALDEFISGEGGTFEGEIVEMSDGRRNRWTHRMTWYGLKQGGICTQFDPRFPNQDYGPEKCYERFFNSPTHGARWELWYSPEAARSLPWGDRSLDVLKQEVESGPPVPMPPQPYIECPRLSVSDDPWAEPVTPEPPETGMTHDDIRRYIGQLQDPPLFGAMQRFHNEVLPRDRPLEGAIKSDAWTEGKDPDFWTGDVVTGGANAYLMRAMISEYLIACDNGRTPEQAIGDGYDAAKRSYDKAVGNTQPITPGAFRGPITREGRDFVAPV